MRRRRSSGSQGVASPTCRGRRNSGSRFGKCCWPTRAWQRRMSGGTTDSWPAGSRTTSWSETGPTLGTYVKAGSRSLVGRRILRRGGRRRRHERPRCRGLLDRPRDIRPGDDGCRLVVARDDRNDLALLRTGLAPKKSAAFRTSIRMGESVEAFGHRLTEVPGNFTLGIVSALVGLREDSRYLQISAPAQPGNSGADCLVAFATDGPGPPGGCGWGAPGGLGEK